MVVLTMMATLMRSFVGDTSSVRSPRSAARGSSHALVLWGRSEKKLRDRARHRLAFGWAEAGGVLDPCDVVVTFLGELSTVSLSHFVLCALHGHRWKNILGTVVETPPQWPADGSVRSGGGEPQRVLSQRQFKLD